MLDGLSTDGEVKKQGPALGALAPEPGALDAHPLAVEVSPPDDVPHVMDGWPTEDGLTRLVNANQAAHLRLEVGLERIEASPRVEQQRQLADVDQHAFRPIWRSVG